DLYAVGVVAFRMLTGKLPFVGQNTMEVIMAHVRHPAPKPSSLKPGLSAGLDALVLSLLEKSPDQRPLSADVARQAVAAMRTSGNLTSPTADPTIVGDETFRPFVPKQPFNFSSLQDDDDGDVAKRTEPFKAMEHLTASPDVTERPQMSPFGGRPADSTLPPDARAPDVRVPDTTLPHDARVPDLNLTPDTTTKNPVRLDDDDDEQTVSSVAARPTEIDHRIAPAEPKKSSTGLVVALLVVVGLLGGAAAWWLKLF
ncbi:MAG: hypothetical protein JNK82_24205, partial [Myxococcaceae bacterium]|nr:hypothetical protein [Myxococcaceae bacterium]